MVFPWLVGEAAGPAPDWKRRILPQTTRPDKGAGAKPPGQFLLLPRSPAGARRRHCQHPLIAGAPRPWQSVCRPGVLARWLH